MPYKVVKVEGGWKVQNEDTGKTYSDKPMSKRGAIRQMRALYAAEKK
jgi:hypothetical protein